MRWADHLPPPVRTGALGGDNVVDGCGHRPRPEPNSQAVIVDVDIGVGRSHPERQRREIYQRVAPERELVVAGGRPWSSLRLVLFDVGMMAGCAVRGHGSCRSLFSGTVDTGARLHALR